MNHRIFWLGACLALAACVDERIADGPIREGWRYGHVLPREAQVNGDPIHGRHQLLNGDFMTCGIPAKLWDDPLIGNVVKTELAGALGGSDAAPRLPGRVGKNADMPYFLNAFTAPNGAEVLNGNCLSCHAGMFNGELVLGLGNSTADFTAMSDNAANSLPLDDETLSVFGLSDAEKANMRMMGSRAKSMTMATMRTVGMNPAEMMAVILAVHHDLETLAWSDDPLMPLVVFDHAGKEVVDPLVTSDPPPWWRAKKKNALFYNGMARGDHRGTMALATSVCVDDVARAKEVDAMFVDIQAFVAATPAPVYPFPIDNELAAKGETVFLAECAGCHGTYGANDTADTYPNLLIPLDVIGTDPVVAEAGVVHAPQMVEWYNESFYGKITRMTPGDPFPGYMPPPLDAVWATAPYLHNGSIPTIGALLDSTKRPKYWKRVDYDSKNYDQSALGWPFEEVSYPQAKAPPGERKFIFDTTYWSQSNRGHTFGDVLTDAEREAVLEYLKTL